MGTLADMVQNEKNGWPSVERQPVTITVPGATWKSDAVHRLEAIIPPHISNISLSVPRKLMDNIVAAERALAALDSELADVDAAVIETVTFALLRSESLASSRIEGLSIRHRALAEALRNPASSKYVAKEVVGNIEAMRAAIALGKSVDPLSPGDILDLHKILMSSVFGIKEGVWRKEQNWIGSADLPDGALHVPPPPDLIPELIEDLCAYIATDAGPSVMRAAIAHAQFESIHPFIDATR
jgi:Fic family protein